MKKIIKMGKIIFAYEKMKRAERSVYFYKNEMKGRFEKDLENSENELKETTKEFEEITTKLNEAIKEAEYKSRTRKLSAKDICKGIKEVEEQLQQINKKDMKGVKFCYDTNAQNFPRAYKYNPMSTLFKAEFNGKEWCITDIFRGTCDTTVCDIIMTEEAKKAIIKKMSRISI